MFATFHINMENFVIKLENLFLLSILGAERAMRFSMNTLIEE